jgi:TM2 domain-containing membrane protein YozV
MKSRGIAIALAFFLGGLGIHKFYLDRPGLGIAYVLLACVLISPFLALLDTFLLLIMSDEEFNRKYNNVV